MEIRKVDTQNFGWFYGTHKRVTRLALKNLPDLKPYKIALEEFAQRPDFDEQGLFNNWHFFSPLQRKNFINLKFRDNAFVKYKDHVNKMLIAVDDKKTDLYIEHAGRAIHFLQDMTQPQHTQKGFIFNKLLNLKNHLAFEGYIKKNQHEIFSEYVEAPFMNKAYEDIFMENVGLSSKSELPTPKTRYAWERIGRNGINQAISSTREFLEKLNRITQPEQNELLF